MSPAALKRAALALAALLVAWGAVALIRGVRTEAVARLAIPRLTAVDVDRVRIEAPGETVVLTRGADAMWEVNGHPAAAAAIEELFTALADSAAPGELVARSSASHGRMAVDSAQARRIRFEAGGRTLADLLLGQRARDYTSAYARPRGADEVYLLGGRLPDLAERGADGWRDKRIAAVSPDSVGRVEIERRGTRYVLQRADGAWRVNGAAADSGAVARLLAEYGDLSASGFPTAAQSDSIRFDRPYRRVRIFSRSDTPLLSLALDSTPSGVWARHASGGAVYRVDAWAVDRFAPAEATLRRAQ